MVDLEELRTNHRKGIYDHFDDTDPHDLIVFEGGSPPRGNNYFSVAVDVTNLSAVNSTTFTIFRKVDFINYKLDKITVYPDDFDSEIKGIPFTLDGVGGDMKITIQSSIAEGSVKNLDFSYSENK